MSDVNTIMDALDAALDSGELTGGLVAINLMYEGGDIETIDNTACQAGLKYVHQSGRIPVLSASKTKMVDNFDGAYKKTCVEYCDWLVNKSPYAPAFVTKDPLFCFERGVVTQTSVNASLMVAAQVMHRYMWEHAGVVETWKRFSKVYSGDFAFLLAQTFTCKSGRIDSAYMGAHMAMSSTSICNPYIINFRDRIIDKAYDTGPYSKVKTYHGFDCIWGSKKENKKWLSGLKDYTKSLGTTSVEADKNPFREVYLKKDRDPYNSGAESFTEDEFFTVLKAKHESEYGDWVNA